MRTVFFWLLLITSLFIGILIPLVVHDELVAIRMVMLSFTIIGIGVYAGVAWKRPDRRLYFVAPISWMINVALFYAARLIGWPDNYLCVNLWSQVIHLHALILLIGGLIIYER